MISNLVETKWMKIPTGLAIACRLDERAFPMNEELFLQSQFPEFFNTMVKLCDDRQWVKESLESAGSAKKHSPGNNRPGGLNTARRPARPGPAKQLEDYLNDLNQSSTDIYVKEIRTLKDVDSALRAVKKKTSASATPDTSSRPPSIPPHDSKKKMSTSNVNNATTGTKIAPRHTTLRGWLGITVLILSYRLKRLAMKLLSTPKKDSGKRSQSTRKNSARSQPGKQKSDD